MNEIDLFLKNGVFDKTCRGPGGGFSEQGSERQKVTRSSLIRRRRSRVEGEEGGGRQGMVGEQGILLLFSKSSQNMGFLRREVTA